MARVVMTYIAAKGIVKEADLITVVKNILSRFSFNSVEKNSDMKFNFQENCHVNNSNAFFCTVNCYDFVNLYI